MNFPSDTRSSWSRFGRAASTFAALPWVLRSRPARTGRYAGRCANRCCRTCRLHPTAHRAAVGASRSERESRSCTTHLRRPHSSGNPRDSNRQDGCSPVRSATRGSAARSRPNSFKIGFSARLTKLSGSSLTPPPRRLPLFVVQPGVRNNGSSARRPSTNGRNCSAREGERLKTRLLTTPFLSPAFGDFSLLFFVRDRCTTMMRWFVVVHDVHDAVIAERG
jgi:hypothetical protein